LIHYVEACNIAGIRAFADHARQENEMSINIGPPAIEELRPRITVIGVGGAGGNAIANMITSEIEGVDFVVANTDAQALNNAIAENRIQLGPDITQGLGAGSRPEVGRAAAEETLAEIERLLDGVHMVFIAAGMGGGTGTGAAPVIAKAARDKGVLTVGVVTKPFLFEGTRRMRSAEAGIEELQKHVDTLIVIPNQNLFLVAKAETTFKEAFQLADEVLQQGVRSITDLMVMPGLINLDFADVRSVMAEMGKAMMGTGEGQGENRALEAAEKAIANPLLDGVSMQGAKGVIISIIGGEDMKLLEVDEAANHIRELVDPNANIIWGSAFNPDLQGRIRVSVVATGIEQTASMAEEAARPLNLGVPRGPVRPMAAPAAAPEPLLERPAPETPAPSPVAAVPAPAPEPEPEPEAAASGELDLADESFGAFEDASQAAPQTGGLHVDEPDADEDEVEETPGSYASLGAMRTPKRGPLDLGPDPADPAPPVQDDLLGSADRLAEEDAPVGGMRRRLPLNDEAASEAPAAPRAAPAGSTLFERMANLSRGVKPAAGRDDGDDDDDSSALNIPRFLGRQNNQ
jgi:cell division protein FtsZ